MTAPHLRAGRWITAAAVLLTLQGGAVAVVALTVAHDPTPNPALVARAPYAAGWAFAVTRQTGPDRPGDDLTAAACQWDVDGRLGPDRADERNAFLAGCGDAVRRTGLEARSR